MSSHHKNNISTDTRAFLFAIVNFTQHHPEKSLPIGLSGVEGRAEQNIFYHRNSNNFPPFRAGEKKIIFLNFLNCTLYNHVILNEAQQSEESLYNEKNISELGQIK